MHQPTEATSQIARALVGELDWERDSAAPAELYDAAGSHGVAPLLWEKLAGYPGQAASIRGGLEASIRADATRDLFVQRELQALLASFAAAGVDVLVTKGTALAFTVYAQPWLRPRTDTDLLVAQDQLAPAERVLTGAGYERSDALSTGALVSHQVAYERTDSHGIHHVVDLHWKIVNPQVLADSLTFADLWRDSVAAERLGPAARVPSVVHSIALACVHRLAHHQGHDRLIWLWDLRLLTASLDRGGWLTLRDLARERRIAGICLDGLRAAHGRLHADLPADIEAALAAAAPAEPSAAYLLGPVGKRDVLISDMRVLRSWTARLLLMREHVFPPAAFMRQRYSGNSWPLPALYVHRLLTGAARWIRS